MLLALVLMPFLGALLISVAQPRTRLGPAILAGLATGLGLVLLFFMLPGVAGGTIVFQHHEWIPAVDLAVSFRLDGLGVLFALLVLGIGLLVIFYAFYYLSEAEATPRFYAFLMLFMGAMLGLVLSENLVQLVLFWELTSLSSFLLIGYRKHDAEARQGARLALMITGGGGLALLAAVVLLGDIVGSYQLSDVLAAGDLIRGHALYPVILVLLLLGAGTKSAQFPFHFWLPHAMSAPTPVSAYLHSATMVKAGIFLVARLFPAVAGTELWFYMVSGMGLATLLVGAYLALFQHDLKGLLAYSTISHLGLIMLLLGLGTPLGEIAGIFHILNHAVFKASLFMAAGIIDHESGSRDMRKLNGLFKYMPHTAILAIVASAAMAGVPLLNGFLSKEMFFAETLHSNWLGDIAWVLPVVATAAGVFSVAYSLRFVHDVFFNGEPVGLPKTPHEPPRWMKVPVEVLVLLCVAVGIFPELLVRPLLELAASAVLMRPLPEFSLAVWHGFNLPLLMSIIALVGGITVYTARHRLFALNERLSLGRSARDLAERSLEAVQALSRALDAGIHDGTLARSMSLLIGAAVVAAVAGFLGTPWPRVSAGTPLDPGSVLFCGLLVAAGIGVAVMHRSRLFAVVLLGVVGLMVSLLFVRLSAPDLALTQLLVEIVTVVLVLLAMHFLPADSPAERSTVRTLRDGGLALVSGVGVAVLCYAILNTPFETISDYFIAQSKPGGGGTNVVNVILVDFRAIDTLGEVTVLGIAAIGVYAMLDGLHLTGHRIDPQGRAWSPQRHPVMLAAIGRLFLPLALLVSAYLFLRGHNEPGGGFIAGLVTGVALIVEYITHGGHRAEGRLRWNHVSLAGAGILIATATGLVSLFFDHPFLTSTFGYVTLPVVGTFEVASALAFDLGVYLGVVGSVLLVLSVIGRLGNVEEAH